VDLGVAVILDFIVVVVVVVVGVVEGVDRGRG
jgi:hypothetical protein